MRDAVVPSMPPGARLRGLEPLERASLPRRTIALARFLLGKIVVREIGSEILSGRIVETEAYLEADPACHAYRGATARNASLFLEAGHAYVYLCYGISRMLNVSSEDAGVGAGVLVRALEPLCGIERMQRARGVTALRDLARGPGRLAQALSIDLAHDGIDLCRRGGELWLGSDGVRVAPIASSVRIGLSVGAEARRRFFIAGNRFVSGPRSLNGPPSSSRPRRSTRPREPNPPRTLNPPPRRLRA